MMVSPESAMIRLIASFSGEFGDLDYCTGRFDISD